MAEHQNALGQPVGAPVEAWEGSQPPPETGLVGDHVRLDRLDPEAHGQQLFEAFTADTDEARWTYLGVGPFASADSLKAWLESVYQGQDPLFYTVMVDGRALGLLSYLRIDPAMGVIEIGHIHFGAALQRSIASTEALYLMMARAFDELGNRRLEWKCHALNAPSRRAALRLGFQYEGTFRQARVVKGRNRDTAWFSIIDSEWPALRDAFKAWLAADNFDASGQQRRSLGAFMKGPRP